MSLDYLDYLQTDSFVRDFKRLIKRYPSLEEDLEIAKRNAIELFHIHKVNNQSVFPITGICTSEVQICKVRKFACKSLKGKGVRSGIRIIYAFHLDSLKVCFIEIYYKGDQTNENRDKIQTYLKSL